MGAYTLSRKAAEDLRAIAEYGASHHGAERAEVYVRELIKALERIAAYPRTHRLRNELRPALRIARQAAHVVVFHIQDDGDVLILRIRHGREDWSTDPA